MYVVYVYGYHDILSNAVESLIVGLFKYVWEMNVSDVCLLILDTETIVQKIVKNVDWLNYFVEDNRWQMLLTIETLWCIIS